MLILALTGTTLMGEESIKQLAMPSKKKSLEATKETPFSTRQKKSLLLLSVYCSSQAGGFTRREIPQKAGTNPSQTFPAEAWHGHVPLQR